MSSYCLGINLSSQCFNLFSRGAVFSDGQHGTASAIYARAAKICKQYLETSHATKYNLLDYGPEQAFRLIQPDDQIQHRDRYIATVIPGEGILAKDLVWRVWFRKSLFQAPNLCDRGPVPLGVQATRCRDHWTGIK